MSGDWPRHQCLHDLGGVAHAVRGAIPRIASGQAGLTAYLTQVCDDPRLHQPDTDRYWDAYTALNRAATGDDPDAVAFARALLLADALHGQAGPDGPVVDLARGLDRLSPCRAAALRRGILQVQAARYEEASTFAPAQLVSLPREVVVADLITVARCLDAGDIAFIAQADYGSDAARHATALSAVLASPDCRFPKGERWYPAEVVELVGHVPFDGHAWRGCIALLILDDIHHDGNHDQLTFRWQRSSDAFLGLRDPMRLSILRGVRHVMESAAENSWDPYFMDSRFGPDASVLIPWEDAIR